MIKNIINKLSQTLKSDLAKVFSLTALSTFIKMLTALISTKIVAVIIGPAGVAMVGQLMNFSTIVMNLASAGINNGVTKYVAEFKECEHKITMLFSTAFRLTIYCSLGVGILMICLHHYLSKAVMLSPDYGYVFIIFGITIIFYAINNLLISITNGFKQFQLYTYINIANSLLGLLFSVCFVLLMGLQGALISVVTYQSIVLIVTLYLLRKQLWFKWQRFIHKINSEILRKYLKFTVASIIFIALTPMMQLFLRGYVISELSSTDAGIWEGLNRISAMYMMIIYMPLTVYYIPRLSELHTPSELREEIIKAYKFIIPITLIGFITIYLLRYFIISILYTPEFFPMASLFGWQLILDFINTCSYVLSYMLIAKAFIGKYTLTSIIFSLLYVGLAYFFLILQHNVVGIIQANIIAQILYFTTLTILFRKILLKRYHNQI